MRKTCSHVKKCSITAAVNHNTRVTKCAQHREDLSNLNEQFRYIEHSLKKEESIIKKLVKEKTKRKLQCNAIPIKEDVLVCKSDTTLDEVKEYCRRVNEKTGMIPLIIDLHRDEGHYDGEEWIPNIHAHIMWRMYNEEGKNVRLQKDGCRKMQDAAAAALGMERGTPKTEKKHIDSADYRVQQQEKKLKRLEKAVKSLEKERKELAIENDKTRRLKSEIEAFEMLTGPTLPETPLESDSEVVWRSFYAKMDVPGFIPIDNIRIMKDAGIKNTFTLYADICGQRVEKELSFREQQHVRLGIATKIQMAVFKLHDFIRRQMIVLRMEWDTRKENVSKGLKR